MAPGRWRVAAQANPGNGIESTVRTGVSQTFAAPFLHGPGVSLWAWPALVGSGALAALAVQWVLLARAGMNANTVTAISLLGCLVGFAGAKSWYLAVHRQHPRQILRSGACIQGFLVASLAVLLAGSAIAGLDVGLVLDVTAAGVFLGMAIRRPGCFYGGCCAGRPTASRWGMWSSDRALADRRVPVQLIEAEAAGVIGLGALTAAWVFPAGLSGGIFVMTFSLYTLARQGLFGLRADSRTSRGRIFTALACMAVIVADPIFFTQR